MCIPISLFLLCFAKPGNILNVTPMPTPTQISRAIAAIERPYPPDNLIQTYKGFLKLRHVLPYYRYNANVLAALVDIVCNAWYSKERVNRLSLVSAIKQYGSKVKAVKSYYGRSKAELHPFPVEVNKKICWLFQRTFDIELPVNRKQAESIKALCNSLLINAAMGEEEESWLCQNVENSPMILNRVLRYPQRSQVISKWAAENYTRDFSHNRRAEMVGWVLDVNPSFVVDKQTLTDDFEFLNLKDKAAIQQYDEEVQAKKIMDNELGGLLAPDEAGNRLPDIFGYDGPPAGYSSVPPQLEIPKRFYSAPLMQDLYARYNTAVPDYEAIKSEFYDTLELFQNKTMLWAITYSRLAMPRKTALLKKHYNRATSNSFFYICRRLQSVELLQWLSKQ